MKNDDGQLNLFDLEKEKAVAAVIAEVFQDNTPQAEMQQGTLINGPLPEELKKGRSNLIDGAMKAEGDGNNEIMVDGKELSECTQTMVSGKISISFPVDMDNIVSYSQKLTPFDREVIDAVSSLATYTQILSASTIYRAIVGRTEDSQVTKGQQKKVEESMERCRSCVVKFNITSALESQIEKGDQVAIDGSAISFTRLEHSSKRGKHTMYKILEIPPFYRWSEKLGKISMIPFHLLDTPISKTDSIIIMQSFLLREIGAWKSNSTEDLMIDYNELYILVHNDDGKEDSTSRTKAKRMRENLVKIFDYWKEKEFVRDYEFVKYKNQAIIIKF